MDFVVVGGGPAGLYFATYVKQKNPSLDVSVVERDEKKEKKGVGYTLDDSCVASLIEIDPNIEEFLRENATAPWKKARTFAPGLPPEGMENTAEHQLRGIERSTLVDYLRSKASESGVNVEYEERCTPARVSRIHADLIVGADGVNSVVREAHRDVFKPQVLRGSNRYIWVKPPKDRNQFSYTFNHGDGAFFMMCRYPTSQTHDSAVIECSSDAVSRLQLAGQDGRISPEGVAYLRTVLPQLGDVDESSFLSQWIQPYIVGCEKVATDKVVVIGDAAANIHYTAGTGLRDAFIQASRLGREMTAGRGSIAQRLGLYSAVGEHHSVNRMRFSRQELGFLEQADALSNSMGLRGFLQMFYLRNHPGA